MKSIQSDPHVILVLPLGGFCPPINGGIEGGVKTIDIRGGF